MLPLFCVWTYISQVENNKMLRKTEEDGARAAALDLSRTGTVLDQLRVQLPSASFPDLGIAERAFTESC